MVHTMLVVRVYMKVWHIRVLLKCLLTIEYMVISGVATEGESKPDFTVWRRQGQVVLFTRWEPIVTVNRLFA